MRKSSRILSMTFLALAVIIGVMVISSQSAGNEAEAGTDVEKEKTDVQYVEPWYNYWGHTGHDGSFILEEEFVNAAAYQNFTINGYEIDGSREAMEEFGDSHTAVEVYDQQVLKYADGKALGVSFPVNKGAVSTADLFAV